MAPRVRLGVAYLLAVAGCAWAFDANELPVRVPAGAEAGLPDAELDDATNSTCELATPPPRPLGASAAGGDELVFALDSFKITTDTEAGIDLDGRCTCAPDAGRLALPSCVPPQGANVACDGTGGRDNAVAGLAASLGLGGKPLDVGYDDSVREGRAATLLQITNYSGAPNDEAVEVAVYDSPAAEAQVPCPTGAVVDGGATDAGKPLPGYGGCDVWSLSTASVVAGGFPRVRTNNAWVRDSVLVAKFDVIVLNPGAVSISIYDATLSGHLAPGVPRRIERLRLAGTIRAKDVLRVVGERRPRPELPALCVDPANLALVRTKVCGRLDLATRSLADGTSTCDSMSFVFEGSAVAARLGAEAPPPPPASACVDAGEYAVCPER